MTSDKIYKLNEVLKRFESTNTSIVGSAIVKRNGLLISSRLPKNIDERNFSAIVATIFGAIDAATTSFETENIQNLIIEFDELQIFALGADEDTLILSLIDINTNLGLILIEIEESIRLIQDILTS